MRSSFQLQHTNGNIHYTPSFDIHSIVVVISSQ